MSNRLLGLLDVHAPVINTIKMGALAYMSRRIHGELVFALLILNSWGCMYFETQAICPSARIDSS